jgi:hypothetical protein
MTPNKLILQTRRPRDGDPGAVEYGWWVVEGDSVYLVDEDGHKTGTSRRLPEGTEPRNLALRMMQGKVGKRNSDFNRKLIYPRVVF